MTARQTEIEVKVDPDDHDVLHTISTVRRALMLAGVPSDVSAEYTEAALRCDSYDELLRVTKERVRVT
jgi:hypothetical protein